VPKVEMNNYKKYKAGLKGATSCFLFKSFTLHRVP